MEKETRGFKRFVIEILEHLLAAGALVAVAALVLNAYIVVESIDGSQTYRVFSTDMGNEFEESQVFYDLFNSAVSDVTQLVVIKEQLETNGVFDASKKIDVTEFAASMDDDAECDITAVYELDDLIKWGKYGVEYNSISMSIHEFVTYFGYVIFPENFTLDAYGELIFDDFYRIEEEEPEGGIGITVTASETGELTVLEGTFLEASGKDAATIAQIQTQMALRTEDELEDMVYAYIMGRDLNGIEISREEDNRLRVTVSVLECRYATVDGEKWLMGYADNWVDYMQLQNNVAIAAESLNENYQRYQLCNDTYKEGNTNIRYCVRTSTEKRIVTSTNISDMASASDEEMTEYFSEYRRYLIYYPDSLVFMGNTEMGESELDEYISLYGYADPDTVHIWIGVDTGYAVVGDAFYNANEIYRNVVPNIWKISVVIAVLVVLWVTIGLYLAFTAKAQEELIWFDHMWTEVFFLLFGVLIYASYLGVLFLQQMAENPQLLGVGDVGESLSTIIRYGAFGLFGFLFSLLLGCFLFSLIRRIRFANFWSDSFLHKTGQGFSKFVQFIFRHRNSVVSVLIPYNLFLFFNLAGIFGIYRLHQMEEYDYLILGIVLALLVVDCAVGVTLFKRNAERTEIIEGIRKIREGEVEFKLDTENLHGENEELADAVNNIGEGIRKAVRTSMKDEQMKTDLITNVSHDIKTPLTSIINYVDLLKRLKITEEPACDYINILDAKANRLKQLTDDLVEASKISSGNIELNLEKLNFAELLNQSLGEFSEKLEEGGIQVVFEKNVSAAYILADSRRMWRVVENLFNNICKYALEGTRAYIDLEVSDGRVKTSVKNISKQQMNNIKPEELTERFIRGDSSRSTEGTGLGLSIAKSLVQAQGGEFEILLDGDLFKIVLDFPEYI